MVVVTLLSLTPGIDPILTQCFWQVVYTCPTFLSFMINWSYSQTFIFPYFLIFILSCPEHIWMCSCNVYPHGAQVLSFSLQSQLASKGCRLLQEGVRWNPGISLISSQDAFCYIKLISFDQKLAAPPMPSLSLLSSVAQLASKGCRLLQEEARWNQEDQLDKFTGCNPAPKMLHKTDFLWSNASTCTNLNIVVIVKRSSVAASVFEHEEGWACHLSDKSWKMWIWEFCLRKAAFRQLFSIE